jgi:hypothetical protein
MITEDQTAAGEIRWHRIPASDNAEGGLQRAMRTIRLHLASTRLVADVRACDMSLEPFLLQLLGTDAVVAARVVAEGMGVAWSGFISNRASELFSRRTPRR